MAVRRDLKHTQIANEGFGMDSVEMRGVADRALLQETQQMIGGGPISVGRLDGRAQHLLVNLKPAFTQVGNGDRLETQSCRGADFKLGVDLRRQLFGGLAIGADARASALTIFVVAEVLDETAPISLNLADAERDALLGHECLRESSRHKTPQTGSPEDTSAMKKPARQALMSRRPTNKRRGGIHLGDRRKLRPIPAIQKLETKFFQAAFDGKYVWMAGSRSNGSPVVLALDPKSEQVWQTTGADDLPQPTEEEALATRLVPFEVAAIELGRAWVAIASFNPDKGKLEAKVIHEARETDSTFETNLNSSSTITFQPSYVVAVGNPKSAIIRC